MVTVISGPDAVQIRVVGCLLEKQRTTPEAYPLSVNALCQLSELLDLSARELQRRRADGGESTARRQVAARMIAIIRRGWTDQGVYSWFHRERPVLGDTAPGTLLDDLCRYRFPRSESRAIRGRFGRPNPRRQAPLWRRPARASVIRSRSSGRPAS